MPLSFSYPKLSSLSMPLSNGFGLSEKLLVCGLKIAQYLLPVRKIS